MRIDRDRSLLTKLWEVTVDDKFYTTEQYRKMYACADCGINTSDNNNYYMIHNKLWEQYGAKQDILCFKCLEKRMGRKLKYTDFNDAPINNTCDYVLQLKKGFKNASNIKYRSESVK